MPEILVRRTLQGDNVVYERPVPRFFMLSLFPLFGHKWVYWKCINSDRNRLIDKLNKSAVQMLKDIDALAEQEAVLKNEKKDITEKSGYNYGALATPATRITVDKKEVRFKVQEFFREPKKEYEALVRPELLGGNAKRSGLVERIMKARGVSGKPHGTSTLFTPDLNSIKESSSVFNSPRNGVDDVITLREERPNDRNKRDNGRGRNSNNVNRRKNESREDFEDRRDRLNNGTAYPEDYN